MRARFRWEDGVDVHAEIGARFGEAEYASFTGIPLHPRQEMCFRGDRGVLRMPAPFDGRVFGEARIELHRGTETVTERWTAANHYELQVAAFNHGVRGGAPWPWQLEAARGTQVMMDAVLAAGGAVPV